MLGRERVSLNAMAFESTCGLIEGVLAAGVNLAEAYIDALGDTSKHRVGGVVGGCHGWVVWVAVNLHSCWVGWWVAVKGGWCGWL
jgi:hypothetical protein